MATNNARSSDLTGLYFCEEASPGVLPQTAVWTTMEPNSYPKAPGSEIQTMARRPFNPSRQRNKGVITDVDASGSVAMDLTQTNFQDLLQGFVVSDAIKKSELTSIASVDSRGTILMPITGDLTPGSLVYLSGFSNEANNGFKSLTAVTTNVSIRCALSDSFANESSPPAAAKIVQVGFKFSPNDLKIVAGPGLPKISSKTKYISDFNFIPGEWIFFGGDKTGQSFSDPANNGFKRIHKAGGREMVIDKSDRALSGVDLETSSVYMFFGRIFKNQNIENMKRRTYQLGLSYGPADLSKPDDQDCEYLVGCYANQVTLDIPTTDKITATLDFMALNSELREASEGLKGGDYPTLKSSDAFNTSEDIRAVRIYSITKDNPAPGEFASYMRNINLTINNNAVGNKAIGVIGSFAVTLGTFEVSFSGEAYFENVKAQIAARENLDVTADIQIVRANSGMIIDLPLISMASSVPQLEVDSPIMLNVTGEAATASRLGEGFDYTLSWTFFDYLPDLAKEKSII